MWVVQAVQDGEIVWVPCPDPVDMAFEPGKAMRFATRSDAECVARAMVLLGYVAAAMPLPQDASTGG